MSKFSFNLQRKELLDKIRDPIIYEYNLAKNLALLSNDPAIIRRFYQIDILQYFKDPWLLQQIQDSFLRYYQKGQAFSYFGVIPMIVQAKVGLLTSGGFECKSGDDEIDEILNNVKDETKLQDLFASGVYWESGIGDVAYRLSYCAEVGGRPLIDIVEPHHLEINYNRGQVVSYVIKEVAEDDPQYELHEIHYLNREGFLSIAYRFFYNGKYVAPNDATLIKQCGLQFVGIDITERVLPFRDFATIVYKQNANNNQLYKGERGVPDIQGLDTIEEALTETLSDLLDAIRKGGVKEYIDERLIPQDTDGRDTMFDPFNKRIISTKGSGSVDDAKKLWQVTKADINHVSYIETIKILMSTAFNKAAISPTTIGMTGLESINSSAESQEAREKTSIRTREMCLNSWRETLRELFDKYLRIYDYISGREQCDYKDIISIHFDEYISPSVENVTDVLAQQVNAGLKARETAVGELNDGFDEKAAEEEIIKIMTENGQQPVLLNNEEVGIPPETNGK
jgi:hypothetical protein